MDLATSAARNNTRTPIHDLPVIVVAALMIFWLYRVLFTNAYKNRKS
jgi:hypothetical protein